MEQLVVVTESTPTIYNLGKHINLCKKQLMNKLKVLKALIWLEIMVAFLSSKCSVSLKEELAGTSDFFSFYIYQNI